MCGQYQCRIIHIFIKKGVEILCAWFDMLCCSLGVYVYIIIFCTYFFKCGEFFCCSLLQISDIFWHCVSQTTHTHLHVDGGHWIRLVEQTKKVILGCNIMKMSNTSSAVFFVYPSVCWLTNDDQNLYRLVYWYARAIYI